MKKSKSRFIFFTNSGPIPPYFRELLGIEKKQDWKVFKMYAETDPNNKELTKEIKP